MNADPHNEPIPFNDLRAHYRAHKAEIDAAVARVLESGWYILGREVEAFEQEFAAYIGQGAAEVGCVGVNSGTDALVIALRALGIGPGDEVITVAHTAVATVAAVALAGATPVLVDIDPTTCTLDPAAAAQAITPRTRALLPVHLYGQPADLAPLLALAERAGLALVEDCAQAHGATYAGRRAGAWGDVACFSFYPTKNLGALGDGGAIVSRRTDLLLRARLLREYGWVPQARYIAQIPGTNSRLDEVQAAVLRVRLRHLDAENAVRAARAADYDARLPAGLITPQVGPNRTHVYHLYVVQTPEPELRDPLRDALHARGIGTAVHYPVPVHRQPAYRDGGVVVQELRVTERIAASVLSLPMHPALTEAHAARVVDAIQAIWPTLAR